MFGIERPAQRLDEGGEIVFQRRGMVARPGAAHEGAAGLIGPEQVGGAAEAVHALGGGFERVGQVENGADIVAVVEQRLEPTRAVADRIERVVGAVLETVLQQDFPGLQRIGGVGGIDHDGVAADVGKILDVILDVEFVGAAVAAADDDDVDLGDVDHGDRVVDRRVHDIDRCRSRARRAGVPSFR